MKGRIPPECGEGRPQLVRCIRDETPLACLGCLARIEHRVERQTEPAGLSRRRRVLDSVIAASGGDVLGGPCDRRDRPDSEAVNRPECGGQCSQNNTKSDRRRDAHLVLRIVDRPRRDGEDHVPGTYVGDDDSCSSATIESVCGEWLACFCRLLEVDSPEIGHQVGLGDWPRQDLGFGFVVTEERDVELSCDQKPVGSSLRVRGELPRKSLDSSVDVVRNDQQLRIELVGEHASLSVRHVCHCGHDSDRDDKRCE